MLKTKNCKSLINQYHDFENTEFFFKGCQSDVNSIEGVRWSVVYLFNLWKACYKYSTNINASVLKITLLSVVEKFLKILIQSFPHFNEDKKITKCKNNKPIGIAGNGLNLISWQKNTILMNKGKNCKVF